MPNVPLDKAVLTKEALRALEITLYPAADMIDRLLLAGIPYTKIEAPAEVPNG